MSDELETKTDEEIESTQNNDEVNTTSENTENNNEIEEPIVTEPTNTETEETTVTEPETDVTDTPNGDDSVTEETTVTESETDTTDEPVVDDNVTDEPETSITEEPTTTETEESVVNGIVGDSNNGDDSVTEEPVVTDPETDTTDESTITDPETDATDNPNGDDSTTDEPTVTEPEEPVVNDGGETGNPDGDSVTEEPTVTEPETEEPSQSSYRYRVLNFSNDEETNTSLIKIADVLTFDEKQTVDQFKTKITDIVRVYTKNTEVINSEINEINTVIENLRAQEQEYQTNLNNLNTQYQTLSENYSAKQEEILAFEDAYKTYPDPNPDDLPAYFDADRLDEETKADYLNLQSELLSLEEEVNTVQAQITELESTNDYSDRIATEEAKINEINRIMNSYEIDQEIPSKYLTEVNVNDLNNSLVPSDDYVEIIIVSEDVPDFSDTETENTPYYYMVGEFVNREVNGTTTKCLAFKSIDLYDSLKTKEELLTYYDFDKIYLISKKYKDIINEKRDTLSNNAITESGMITLLNNLETFVPESDISELSSNDNSAPIPSLSVLIKSESDGGEIEDGEEQPDTPQPDIDSEYDKYLRGGKITIFNGIIFIVPSNSDGVKRIVFVNGYYYVLMKNCYIYKLDENYNLVTLIDLTKISSDISKTDIFSIGNMLIIQSDRSYLTDSESIKNNYGIVDTDVTIDSIKLNTKTIVKINMK